MEQDRIIDNLIKNGFKKEEVLGYNDTDVQVYSNKEFQISLDSEDIKGAITAFNSGSRICLMNADEHDEYDEDTCKILVQSISDDGIWILENLNDAYIQIEEMIGLDNMFTRLDAEVKEETEKDIQFTTVEYKGLELYVFSENEPEIVTEFNLESDIRFMFLSENDLVQGIELENGKMYIADDDSRAPHGLSNLREVDTKLEMLQIICGSKRAGKHFYNILRKGR